MAGSKEIRTKIKSVENTRKITKAMEMVAASKMRKASSVATYSDEWWSTRALAILPSAKAAWARTATLSLADEALCPSTSQHVCASSFLTMCIQATPKALQAIDATSGSLSAWTRSRSAFNNDATVPPSLSSDAAAALQAACLTVEDSSLMRGARQS